MSLKAAFWIVSIFVLTVPSVANASTSARIAKVLNEICVPFLADQSVSGVPARAEGLGLREYAGKFSPMQLYLQSGSETLKIWTEHGIPHCMLFFAPPDISAQSALVTDITKWLQTLRFGGSFALVQNEKYASSWRCATVEEQQNITYNVELGWAIKVLNDPVFANQTVAYIKMDRWK